MNTRIIYRYSDAANYKKYSTGLQDLIVGGEVSYDELIPYLQNEEFFIPDQLADEMSKLGYGTGMENINELDMELDHCWHIINNMEPTNNEAQIPKGELIKILSGIKWDDNYFLPTRIETELRWFKELFSRSIVIIPDGVILSDAAEKLEDKLKDFLQKQGISGIIRDGITNNDIRVD